MTDATTEAVTGPVGRAEEARTPSTAQVWRWLGTGIAAVVLLSLVGGLLVGLFTGRNFDRNQAVAQCAKAIRVFDLLVVSPLAIGAGAALVVAVPTARVLRARRSAPDPDGSMTRRNSITLAIAAVCGFVTAALFWSVSGLVVPRTSITAAHWVNGDSTGQLHKDFYGYKLPGVETWSITESIGLALLLVAVAAVTGLRYSAGQDRPSARQVLVTTVALTIVLGGVFAGYAAHSYDHVQMTPVKDAQGQHHSVLTQISKGDGHTDEGSALRAPDEHRDAVVRDFAGS